MKALALESRVPMAFGLVATEGWQDQLALLDETAAGGGRMYGQSHSRGMNVLMSFRTHLPFDSLDEWKPVRSQWFDEQRRLLADPEIRRRLVHAAHHGTYPRVVGAEARKPDWKELRIHEGPFPPYPLVADVARERGCDPVDLMIDLALSERLPPVLHPVGDPGPGAEGARRPRDPSPSARRDVVLGHRRPCHADRGLLDADALARLLGTRARGVSRRQAVHMIAGVPAAAWGLRDRGVLRKGMAADMNVIDFERLMPNKLEVRADLPGGGKRLVQGATGYAATIVAGKVVLREGVHTGELPGQLVRNSSAQASASDPQ